MTYLAFYSKPILGCLRHVYETSTLEEVLEKTSQVCKENNVLVDIFRFECSINEHGEKKYSY